MSKRQPVSEEAVERLQADVLGSFSENRLGDALRAAQQLIEGGSASVETLRVAATSAYRMGFLLQSEGYWKKILALLPNDAQSVQNLGSLYMATGMYDEAEDFLTRILKSTDRPAEAHIRLALMHKAARHVDKSIAHFHAALAIDGTNKDALLFLGKLYHDLRRPADAEACFVRSMQLHPNDPQAYFDLATLRYDQERLLDAEQCLRQAIKVDPAYENAYANLGVVLKGLKRYEEAEAVYKVAISLLPSDPQRHGNLGVLYVNTRRFADAEQCYRRALKLKPDYIDVVFNLSYVLLVRGLFDEGWRAYEARYDSRMTKPVCGIPKLPYPQWRGDELGGKTVVIWHEQGFGDIIQFARFAAELKKRGAAYITFVCTGPLHQLLSTVPGVDAIVDSSEAPRMRPHDFWVLAASIPLHCHTRLETIPSHTPYLSVLPQRRDKWIPRIQSKKFKVGLVWKANANHKSSLERSLASIQQLRALWAVKGVEFYSLQKVDGEEEGVSPPQDQPLIHLGSEIADFADTAAIAAQMDLIICVDTAIVHVAGGLDKPVWVLLPFVADWRWQTDREDTPWYRSVRLFRQTRAADWSGPVQRVHVALEALVGKIKTTA